MKLSTILDGINYEGYADDRVITGIFYDSRKIKKDSLFIAIKGFNVDLSKSIGPFGLSAGIIKIDNDVKISSSLGNADVPIDDYFLPKFGVSVQLSNYRAEISRTFLTTNSYLNNLMLSYIINLL